MCAGIWTSLSINGTIQRTVPTYEATLKSM